jgi:hypothetical protein
MIPSSKKEVKLKPPAGYEVVEVINCWQCCVFPGVSECPKYKRTLLCLELMKRQDFRVNLGFAKKKPRLKPRKENRDEKATLRVRDL